MNRTASGLMNGAHRELKVGVQCAEKANFSCFNGNPDSDKPPREHVFTQVGDTNAFRLIEQNPAWSVVLIKKN